MTAAAAESAFWLVARWELAIGRVLASGGPWWRVLARLASWAVGELLVLLVVAAAAVPLFLWALWCAFGWRARYGSVPRAR